MLDLENIGLICLIEEPNVSITQQEIKEIRCGKCDHRFLLVRINVVSFSWQKDFSSK